MRARILCLAAALAFAAAGCGGEETPTCSDGKQNGAETDVDCGGGCPPCADGLRCGVAADCQSGACGAGVCLKSLARPCAAPGECASGSCADGVCCATGCSGVCRSCNAAGSIGTCTMAPAGTDAKDQCPDEGAASCGLDGLCDGAGACRLYAAGTQCAAASCVDAVTAQPAAACDGAGTCVVPSAVACQPLVCSGGACLQTCVNPVDCAPGFECAGGLCLKVQGASCAAPAECASGFCTDGRCCESACGGTCERCDQSGREGFCDAAPAATDPDDECPAEATATCGFTGTCDGARACALFPNGAICVAASCAGATSNLAHTCDGAGTCVDRGTADCTPYLCSPATGLCPAACATSADCVAGFYCDAQSTCVAKLAQGAPCGGAEQCASGFCADGHCCDSGCAGTCERCNLAGALGICSAVPAGQDPDDECPAEATATCRFTGVCSGTRACALFPAGAICAFASCVGNVSNRADTCDGAGTCVDGGAVPCAPYACVLATGLCATACTGDAECAPGYYCSPQGQCLAKLGQGTSCLYDAQCLSSFCADAVCCDAPCGGNCRSCSQPGKVGTCSLVPAGTGEPLCGSAYACSASGQCLLKDGEACVVSAECLHQGCCRDSIISPLLCRDLATDQAHCGQCGNECSLTGASQNACSAGVCTPQCLPGHFSCDANGANGCEVNLTQTTLDKCPAAVGTSWDTCGASRCGCGLACCDNGFDTTPAWTTSGNGSQLFQGQVTGLAGCGGVGLCAGDFHHRLTLEVPPDADYDLYVKNGDVLYGAICAERGASTGAGLGVDEAVSAVWPYNVLAAPIYYVEVVWKAGGSCGNNWTLRVYGASCD